MKLKSHPFTKFWFLDYADDYYILTRFCYFSFLQSMAFHNAHHAIEYYLKAGISDNLDMHSLKRLGHNLENLWDQYIRLLGTPPIDRRVISYLNRIDELRYPRIDSFTHILWGMSFSEFFERFNIEELQVKVACFSMHDIDNIVFELRKAIPLDGELKIRPLTKEQKTYLFKENEYFKKGKEGSNQLFTH